MTSTGARVVLAVGAASVFAIGLCVACGGGEPAPALPSGAPAGPGYDDLRALSHDECVALKDHQIEIAVSDALAIDGGSTELEDAGERLQLEAELRIRYKAQMDAFVEHCTGRTMRSQDLRCLRYATTIKGFEACGDLDDAGPRQDATDAPEGDAGAP